MICDMELYTYNERYMNDTFHWYHSILDVVHPVGM